jgi:peptidoglycan-N-acetylglucosamine deacetylase
MAHARDLHVLISFDMETDIGSWTPFHQGVAKGTAPIIEVLDRHRIKSTFLYTGDAAIACPESVQMVKQAGHEIGCHTLHHESMGDPLIDIPFPPVLPEEVDNRLAKATGLIEQIAGVRPVSFRAPRGWVSNEMMKSLDRLGYLVDSSYMTWFHKDHFLPYHSSADDWRRSGRLGILEIPLFCDAVVADGKPVDRYIDQWPVLRMRGGEALAEMILGVAKMLWAQDQPALACLYLHPWEFVEMSPVYQTNEARIEFADIHWRNAGDVALKELEVLIRRLSGVAARYHTLKGFGDLWVEERK